MATPTYNSGGTNGLTPLALENNGMSSLLSSTGNTIRVLVQALEPRVLEYSPPGGNWTVQRSTGLAKRRVVWDVQLKADSDADLNAVETAVEEYLEDGRAYVLTDGKGRTADYATLRSAAREGPRVATGSARLQKMKLTFDVLWPRVASNKL